MTDQIINSYIDNIEENVNNYVRFVNEKVISIDQNVSDEIKRFRERTDYIIIKNETQAIKLVFVLIQEVHLRYINAMFHASPQLFATILSLLAILDTINKIIKWLSYLKYLKILFDIVNILAIVWPDLRTARDKIYGKVSKFSREVGFGTDGLIHLLQAGRGGINILGGVLGKDRDWFELKILTSSITTLTKVSEFASMIDNNPELVLEWAYGMSQRQTMEETRDWWDKTVSWLTDTTSKAEIALQKVNDTIDNLTELHNNLPQFVRDYIPQDLTDGLIWVDNQIDDTILPALTDISKEFSEMNTELQAQRDKAQELANKLMLPGDLLLGVDELTGENKKWQEIKIDDVTSRFYNEEAALIEEEDAEIVEYLESIMGILALKIKPPVETMIETMPSQEIVWDKAEQVDRWFVGDF